MFGWTAGDGEHPCDERESGRGAYGLSEAAFVGDAFFGKFVEGRSVG